MYYMFLADGFEETEALVTLDMLRRAEIPVQTVGINTGTIRGAHEIIVYADIIDAEFTTNNCDGIILPGGMPGTENLFASDTVINAVEYCFKSDRLISAICAAPVIMGRKGLLAGKKATCYPGFENELTDALIQNSGCVVDSNIITAKAAGCVFEFSYEIISYIKSQGDAGSIIQAVHYKGL